MTGITTRGLYTALSADVAGVQGAYFLLTGLWPIFLMDSFIALTGPKVELWLVKTVAALVVVIGGTLLLGRRSRSREIVFLGAGSAVALALIEIIYVSMGVISPVYLIDTALEVFIVTLWGHALLGVADRRPGDPNHGLSDAAPLRSDYSM